MTTWGGELSNEPPSEFNQRTDGPPSRDNVMDKYHCETSDEDHKPHSQSHPRRHGNCRRERKQRKESPCPKYSGTSRM